MIDKLLLSTETALKLGCLALTGLGCLVVIVVAILAIGVPVMFTAMSATLR